MLNTNPIGSRILPIACAILLASLIASILLGIYVNDPILAMGTALAGLVTSTSILVTCEIRYALEYRRARAKFAERIGFTERAKFAERIGFTEHK